MNNMYVLLLLIVVNFTLISIAFKLFGKKGLILYMIISVISANIQISKELVMFGPLLMFGKEIGYATLGNVMFSGIFLTTDMLNEKYGEKETLNAIYISIFANISFVIVMAISVIFDGWVYGYNSSGYDDYTDAFNYFFSINGPIFLSMIVGNSVYFISQIIDVFLYKKIRIKKPDTKFLWLRNNGSTFISQFVDTILITVGLIIIKVIPGEFFLEILITTLIIKYIIAILDTPFLYLLNRIVPINEKKTIK